MMVLDTFRKHLSDAMVRLNESDAKRHVTMVTNIDDVYPEMPFYLKRSAFEDGFTTHPNIELVRPHQMCYRLRAGCSASDTLESMLTEHITMIDCVTATCLAHYLALLATFKELLGDKDGKERFDRLFGHRDGSTPDTRKMIFSLFGVNMGTNIMPYDNLRENLPCLVQPISYIFPVHEQEKLNPLNVSVGTLVSFSGDKQYCKKHPLGGGGAFSGIVTEMNPLKLRSFGCGKDSLSPTELLEKHMAAFAMPPSASSLAELKLKGKTIKDVNQIKFNPENMLGLVITQHCASSETLESMVYDDINSLITRLDQYIQHTLETRRQPHALQRAVDSLSDRLGNLLSERPPSADTPPPSTPPAKEILPQSSAKKPAPRKAKPKSSDGGLLSAMKSGFLI